MARITADQEATERRDNLGAVTGVGIANKPTRVVSTVEAADTTAGGHTILFGEIPSGARIVGGHLYWDDLATTGSPELDIGLAGASITADPDAISNGNDVSSAGSGLLITDAAHVGQPAWDLVNGQTSDPKENFQVYGTITTAATTQVGTVTLELDYIVD